MAKKSMMIDFQHPRIDQVLEVILTGSYIKMGGSGMLYTIGGHKSVDKMQKKLMGLTESLLVCLLTSQYFPLTA